MNTTEELLNLDPEEILIRDNVRFGLKNYRIDSLAESIMQAGGVRTPITVEELEEPVDGKKYALQVGRYRTAAVAKLNAEGAGLTLPARVAAPLTDAERLVAQVSENNDRENMSPMDKAIAIQKMIAAGLSKMDIRKAFAAPGGRKGLKMQPASNSHVNMLTSFLEFPKNIQTKIHDGVIGMDAAYELSKFPKDKWDAILERAEAERIKKLEREEKDETSYLEGSKKAEAAEQAVQEAEQTLTQAQQEAADAEKLASEKAAAVADALKSRLTAKGEEKKKAQEHFKAAEQELKAAQQVADAKAKELAKISDKVKSAAEKAQAAKDRLEAARKAKTAKAAGKPAKEANVKAGDVVKAGKQIEGKPVKLNANEMREAIKSIVILSDAKHPKTSAVGQLITQCFDGVITDGQLQLGISRLLGEDAPAKAAPAAAAKPAAKK